MREIVLKALIAKEQPAYHNSYQLVLGASIIIICTRGIAYCRAEHCIKTHRYQYIKTHQLKHLVHARQVLRLSDQQVVLG